MHSDSSNLHLNCKTCKTQIGVVENDHRQSCMLTLLRCASNAAITFSVSICFCVIRAHVEKYAKCLIVLHFLMMTFSRYIAFFSRMFISLQQNHHLQRKPCKNARNFHLLLVAPFRGLDGQSWRCVPANNGKDAHGDVTFETLWAFPMREPPQS